MLKIFGKWIETKENYYVVHYSFFKQHEQNQPFHIRGTRKRERNAATVSNDLICMPLFPLSISKLDCDCVTFSLCLFNFVRVLFPFKHLFCNLYKYVSVLSMKCFARLVYNSFICALLFNLCACDIPAKHCEAKNCQVNTFTRYTIWWQSFIVFVSIRFFSLFCVLSVIRFPE